VIAEAAERKVKRVVKVENCILADLVGRDLEGIYMKFGISSKRIV